MTAALRTRLAEDALGPGRLHAEWMPYRHRADGRATGVGVGAAHATPVGGYFSSPHDDGVRALAAAGMAVVLPASSAAWGNADAVEAVGGAVAHLRNELGCRDRVGLLGFSTGALAVCGWARQHADEVSAIALVTPTLDLAHMFRSGVCRTEIERAHGGRAGAQAAIAAKDPVTYAPELRRIPIQAWYSSNDPLAPWQSMFLFAERHRGDVTLASLGPVGHDPTAARGADIADFLDAHR